MSDILIDKVLECTYLECLECCSVHRMDYFDGSYVCKECYREQSCKIIDPGEILVNWKQLIKLVKKNSNQIKILRILLNNIYKKKLTKEEIKNYYNYLLVNGTIVL